MQFVFSSSARPNEAASVYVRQLDRALLDIQYEIAVLNGQEKKLCASVRAAVDRGGAESAKPDCTRIAHLRRQVAVLSRYEGILMETKTSFQVVRSMDEVQRSMRVIGAMSKQINERMGRAITQGRLQDHIDKLGENSKTAEELINKVMDGQAASAEEVLSEFRTEADPIVEEMLSY